MSIPCIPTNLGAFSLHGPCGLTPKSWLAPCRGPGCEWAAALRRSWDACSVGEIAGWK